MSNILSGNKGPSVELITGLYVSYRENFHWVLTGEGEMVLETEKESGVAEDTPIYKEEKPATDEPDHELKNKLIQTQDKLISQMELIRQLENSLAETKVKLKVSEELAARIRVEDEETQRGDILKKKIM